MATDKKDTFEKLSPAERARTVSAVRLIKHFRSLEKAGMSSKEETAKNIGAVKILESLARGDFKEKITVAINPS